MSNFDTLFFEQHINSDEKIEKVFHRHFFVIAEDLLVWIFFALAIPTFLYYFNVFSLQQAIPDRTYIHAYLLVIYFVLLYKIFDWYLDVWIATNRTLVEMRWKWFTPQLLYISYEKIESIEQRTPSWLYSILGISDIVIHLSGNEHHTLSSAAEPKDIVEYLQEKTRPKEEEEKPDDRGPFEVMVDTLSGIVKNHLNTDGKNHITKDYIEKLDSTLSEEEAIDLRTLDEKEFVEKWKEKNIAIPITKKH